MLAIYSCIYLCCLFVGSLASIELPEEVAPFAKPPHEPQSGPGIKSRLTAKGLDYANFVASQVFAYQAGKIKIPDFATPIGGPGKGHGSAANMKIIQFNQPQFWYKLVAPHELIWGTKGGSMRIEGDWSAKYKYVIALKGKGTFDVKVNDILFKIGAQFGSVKGKPRLTASTCQASVGDLDVNIKGGIIGWVIDRFSGKIEQQVRMFLNAKLCQYAKGMIDYKANHWLSTLPAMLPVGAGLVMDNHLIGAPSVTDKFLEADFKGEISWHGEGKTPFNPPPMALANETSRMMYMWGSDYVVNSLLSAAYRKDLLIYALTKDSTPEFAPYLRTTCPGATCIGEAFLNLSSRYPNKTCEFYLQAMAMPTVRINKARAVLQSESLGQMWVPEANGSATHLANFWIDFKGTLQIFIMNGRVTGVLRIIKLSVNVTESKMGRFTDAEMDLFMLFVEPFLEGFVNSKLKPGLPIPRIKDVSFVHPRIIFRERAIEIQTDAKFMHFEMPEPAPPKKP